MNVIYKTDTKRSYHLSVRTNVQKDTGSTLGYLVLVRTMPSGRGSAMYHARTQLHKKKPRGQPAETDYRYWYRQTTTRTFFSIAYVQYQ
jgi:hypothetical protein